MALSVREQILAALAARLAALASDNGYAFERNRLGDIEDGETPAIVLHDGGQTRLDGETHAMTRELSLAVEVYCAAANGAALGAAVSDMAARVIRAMRPDHAGLTVGGLAHDVREVEMTSPEFGADPDAGYSAVFEISFSAIFETAEFDPYATP